MPDTAEQTQATQNNGKQPPPEQTQDPTGKRRPGFSVPPSSYAYTLEEEQRLRWENYLKDRSPFPQKMRREAYYGIAREVVEIMGEYCEACPEAMLIQFLVIAGNLMGRNPYVSTGSKRLFPNEYTVLAGPTGSRKGAALDINYTLWCELFPDWFKDCIIKNIESGEALIDRLRDEIREPYKKKNKIGFKVKLAGVDDKRLLGVEEEFGSLLRVAARKGNNVSGVVRELWDSPLFSQTGGKKEPRRATNPHFSFIGHITPKDLKDHLTEDELANGYVNRVLWCATYRAKTLANADEIDWNNHPDILKRLKDIFNQYPPSTNTPVRFTRTEEGNRWWGNHYRARQAEKERDRFIDGIVIRDTSHLLKLALIYAVLDGSTEINRTYLEAAKAICDYVQATARWLFMERLGDRQTQKILFGLMRMPQGMLTKDIRTEICGSNTPVMDITRSLEELAKNDLITMKLEEDTRIPGRRVERWFSRVGEVRR